jgi:membrane protease YdiL (CAAX protease family)
MSDEEMEHARIRVILLSVTVEGGLMVIALLTGWMVDQPPLAYFRWTFADALWGLVATLPMLVLFGICLRWPVGPLKPIEKFCDEVLRPMLRPCTLLDMAGIAVFAGVGEEMLFRGVMQPVFESWTGSVWLAIAMASALFGLAHAITAAYLVLAALLGFYLGWLFHATGNLMTPVVAHAVYDFVALVVLLRLRKASGPVVESEDLPPREDP